jgi:hypothetical protein
MATTAFRRRFRYRPVVARTCFSKLFEEDDEAGSKLDKAEEIVGVVLLANENPGAAIEARQETLDEPASHVAVYTSAILRRRLASVAPMRRHISIPSIRSSVPSGSVS